MTENAQKPAACGWLLENLQHAWLFGKRAAVLSSIAAAVYAIAGSCMFAEWWYGFFWDGGYRKTRYIADALRYLLDDRFGLVISLLVAFFATVIAASLLRNRLVSFTDRFAALIVFSAVAAISADALVVYHTQAETYQRMSRAKASIGEAAHKFWATMGAFSTPPKIEPPIYFHYLNSDRIDGLYNQIVPELEVKEREVTGSRALKGKAEVGLGTSSVGIEADGSDGSKSILARTQFSNERKCVEVMRYVRETWPSNYYTNQSNWYFRSQDEVFRNLAAALEGEPFDATKLKPIPPIGNESDADKKRIDAETKRLQSELQTELATVRGMVFVEGDFDKSTNADKLILTEKFSETPFKCFFRVILPAKVSQSLPPSTPLHLRVFGEVTRPLAKDGFVDVAGVAVF